MTNLFIVYSCLVLIFGGLIAMILSPIYSVILNLVLPPKPIYKKNSSIIHLSVGDVRFLRKNLNHKVFIFGVSMCLAGLIMINSSN